MNYRGNQLNRPVYSSGFALPTVLIASFTMMLILLASVSATVAVRLSLAEQYNSKLTKTAAEAGIEYAKACLKSQNNVIWENPLMPNTNCNGEVDQSCNSSEPNYPDCQYLIYDSVNKVSSTFKVGADLLFKDDGSVSDIQSVGSTKLLSDVSDGTKWREYQQSAYLDPQQIITKESYEAKVLIVGGGGGGQYLQGGGGGGGGVLSKTISFIPGTIKVTVGKGGTGASNWDSTLHLEDYTAPTDGSSSAIDYYESKEAIANNSLTSIKAFGGGAGGKYPCENGKDGGSGGGAGGSLSSSCSANPAKGGNGVAGQGYKGGDAVTSPANGAGGGGAGGVGANVVSGLGSAGGNGISSDISGAYQYYGGGGGAGASNYDGAGGEGGGGIGPKGGGRPIDGIYNGFSVNGTDGLGGGGGGLNRTIKCDGVTTDYKCPGGNGGSGVVIISYKTGSMYATGGEISYTNSDNENPTSNLQPGGYTIHKFTNAASVENFTVSDPRNIARVLVVGGGGSGGADIGGGGGGGGVKYSTDYKFIRGGLYNIQVGAGGSTSGYYPARNGGDSYIENSANTSDKIMSYGGGQGGLYCQHDPSYRLPSNGGSGGGAAGSYPGSPCGVDSPGNALGAGGNNGGIAVYGVYAGGGGGGAGGVGGNGAAGNIGGSGGNGIINSITGEDRYYGGGGGGGAGNGSIGVAGLGGLGGGGNGVLRNAPISAASGVNGLGGGGGGHGYNSTGCCSGGTGGSGIVIISYPTDQMSVESDGVITLVGGNTIHTFSSVGSHYFKVISVKEYL